MPPLGATLDSLTTPCICAASDPLTHVLPHEITKFFGAYSFTNHIVMLLFAALLLAIFLPMVARKEALVPRGFRNFLEALMQFIREEVARPILGKQTDRFIPLLWTFFFLILTTNLLGMIPFGAVAGLITQNVNVAHHIGGTATANFSITVGFALVAFVAFHVSGMREHGIGKYWKNFFFGHMPKALAPLAIPLEIIGAAVKPFALAIRLFANMTAGHIVLAVLAGFAAQGLVSGGGFLGVTAVAWVGAVAIGLLELFVAFLQAYIFTFLTTLFLGAAIAHEH